MITRASVSAMTCSTGPMTRSLLKASYSRTSTLLCTGSCDTSSTTWMRPSYGASMRCTPATTTSKSFMMATRTGAPSMAAP